MKEEQTAAYSVEIWKRFRKWGGIPTAITQNVKDLLASREVENIFENSDFVLMLNQAQGDREILARQLNIVMGRMISILDTKAPDDMKENFYHGLLLGLLRGSNPDWLIKSNRESGDGFNDILIKPENPDLGIVIEVKYAKEFKGLDAACDAALAQIKQKRYDETLRDEGRFDVLAYGIAFCKKRCKAVGEKL